MARSKTIRRSLIPFSILFLILFSNALLANQENDPPDKYSQFNRAQSLNRDVSFHSPTDVATGKDATSVELLVHETVSLLDGEEVRHRCYNGGLVGPTIRVFPGQKLNIRLKNMLGPESEGHDPNLPHGFNTTNLHTHGLHVSPNSPADNVFETVGPGESFNYVFDIPQDHPPGTHWYHAHKHGSTALQLASGMAGALIVKGGLDNAPVIKDIEEKVLVFQQFTIKRPLGEIGFIDPDSIYGDGDADVVEAINGVVTPTIMMRPGEIQRWRIIHAGTTDLIRLDIEGINFHEIAVDGLATGTIVTKNRLSLYPGYRSDVLVQAPNEEVERLVTSKIDNQVQSLRNVITDRRNLLKIVVTGEPAEQTTLPTQEQLAPFAAFTQQDVPSEVSNRRRIVFSSFGSMKFLVNGEQFDPDRVDQTIELGSSEEWEITSEQGVHPFHIHVNPFASRRKDSDDPWVWRDTIAVRSGRPMVLRTTYKEFTGKTVLHCHNLKHEDLGMMQSVEIVEPADGPIQVESVAERPPAPDWSAIDIEGKVVSSNDFQGQPVLIVLHRGMNCLHCAQQMLILKEHSMRFRRAGISLVAISQFIPPEKEIRKELGQLGFPLLVDKELGCFRKFGRISSAGIPDHALILVDARNQIAFQNKTEFAVTDPKLLVDRIIDMLD